MLLQFIVSDGLYCMPSALLRLYMMLLHQAAEAVMPEMPELSRHKAVPLRVLTSCSHDPEPMQAFRMSSIALLLCMGLSAIG